MKKMALLFSHTLSALQKEDAQTNWNISTFIRLPDDIQQLWSNLSPTQELPILLFTHWLSQNTNTNDIILVQGEFGICFSVADWCLKNGRVPVYATTERVCEEKMIEGKIIMTHQFEHKGFRKYSYWKED